MEKISLVGWPFLLLMLVAKGVGENDLEEKRRLLGSAWNLLAAGETVGTLSRGAESSMRAPGFRKPVKRGTSNRGGEDRKLEVLKVNKILFQLLLRIAPAFTKKVERKFLSFFSTTKDPLIAEASTLPGRLALLPSSPDPSVTLPPTFPSSRPPFLQHRLWSLPSGATAKASTPVSASTTALLLCSLAVSLPHCWSKLKTNTLTLSLNLKTITESSTCKISQIP